jgi:hypothetical protein
MVVVVVQRQRHYVEISEQRRGLNRYGWQRSGQNVWDQSSLGTQWRILLIWAKWPLVPKFAGSNPSDFSGEKILSMPSFGGEVKPSVPCRRFAACKISRHLPWKSHAVGKIGSAISRPYFLPSVIEVFHFAGRGAPLEMTGKLRAVHKWPVRTA